MKQQGKVINWNDDKGFGFVEPNGGGERAFVHIKAFKSSSRRPVNGDVIIYESVYDSKNRYKAEDIKFSSNTANTSSKISSQRSNKKLPLHSQNTKAKNQSGSVFSVVVFMVFGIFLGTSVLIGKLPTIIISLYVLLSSITFITYWRDKSAAKKGHWRTEEITLHLLSLIGGWPGAYLAQNILRHKSIKKQFKQVFWITVLLNVSAVIWLHTEKGRELLTILF